MKDQKCEHEWNGKRFSQSYICNKCGLSVGKRSFNLGKSETFRKKQPYHKKLLKQIENLKKDRDFWNNKYQDLK